MKAAALLAVFRGLEVFACSSLFSGGGEGGKGGRGGSEDVLERKKSRKKFGKEKDRGLGKGGGRCENNVRTKRAG